MLVPPGTEDETLSKSRLFAAIYPEAVHVADPIVHWIDQRCWKPPALPHSTFRAKRTFAGPHLPQTALRRGQGSPAERVMVRDNPTRRHALSPPSADPGPTTQDHHQ
ncbi:hypothetical protein [Lentzea sp. HUAS12]|uniref:hypothetical protein n=1 Tax=Lentzea sp. HUAS12 TaxID=2951806 RepID=UPI00209E33C9|nr:hypothetical protein [Lentzea sp. HUAS12]USX56457.1 hypothetical protein ND450_20850 [Lentzea sp. HUAS12]